MSPTNGKSSGLTPFRFGLPALPPGLPPPQIVLAWRRNDDSRALRNFIKELEE